MIRLSICIALSWPLTAAAHLPLSPEFTLTSTGEEELRAERFDFHCSRDADSTTRRMVSLPGDVRVWSPPVGTFEPGNWTCHVEAVLEDESTETISNQVTFEVVEEPRSWLRRAIDALAEKLEQLREVFRGDSSPEGS